MPRIAVAIVGLLAGAPALAAPPVNLPLPLACEPGRDCWIVKYVDHDPGPEVKDYRCGRLADDGHHGTDFAIRDLGAMADGVEVRAVAAGVVQGVRNDMPDVNVQDTGLAAVASRECGNGVRLDHGDGWATQYCHLRRGSVRVAVGDPVPAGHALGLVGMSGAASFPHLELTMSHEGASVDPFVGLRRGRSCELGEAPLWHPEVVRKLAYQPAIVTDAGFATAGPDPGDVQRGYHREGRLPTTSPALVLWVEGYWLQQGDRVRFRITGPDGGTLLDHETELERDWARWVGFAGEPRPKDSAWPAGVYRGEVRLERGRTAATLTAVLEREVAVR